MKEFYLIGLTGNLGCGKSTVRRMLEQLGARGIDADLLGHAAMERGTSSWNAIVKTFGPEILRYDGEINRQNLGKRVFGNPEALRQLEQILHPAVGEMVKQILRENDRPVVVLEAIKLIESGLAKWCDALWVVTCSPDAQVERVVRDRKMRSEDARARLSSQSAQDEKARQADVVIDNSGDTDKTRDQVATAWMKTVRVEQARDKRDWLLDYGSAMRPASAPLPATPTVTAPTEKPTPSPTPAPPSASPTSSPTSAPVPPATPPEAAKAEQPRPRDIPVTPAPPRAEPPRPKDSPATPAPPSQASAPRPPATAQKQSPPPVPAQAPRTKPVKRTDPSLIIQVRPARRGDLPALGRALARFENRKEPLSQTETLKRLGERGYRIALAHGQIVAIAAWEAENLVAITRDIRADSPEIARQALPALLALIEQDANSLVCEVSVLLVDERTPSVISELATKAKYEKRGLDALHKMWRQVISERLRNGTTIWAKPLRKDLITKPIE